MKMETWMGKKRKFGLFLALSSVVMLLYLSVRQTNWPLPSMLRATPPSGPTCGAESSETITPLPGTRHLLVSAFADHRVKSFDVRIIGIFKLDAIQPLRCVFCCSTPQDRVGTRAEVRPHSDNFNFPYGTTDVLCRVPQGCAATHVTLVPEEEPPLDDAQALNRTFLPIRNRKDRAATAGPEHNLTVCVSTLFGEYNNVLQFAQTLEMYRLLGINRVVVYDNSCGPELSRLLDKYSEEGFVERVPWPVHHYLTPSHAWNPTLAGGDLHYYGQTTTLNECVYRSSERSRYVLLHDIDEIVVPYEHGDLVAFLETVQREHPKVGVFLIENHIFPKQHFEPSRKFHLPQWDGVPGVNILEHIYREEPSRSIYHPYKMIVQPRLVEQTSVHSVLKSFGEEYKVPPGQCRLIHVRVPLQGHLTLEQLHVDKRLWDFSDRLIPRTDHALRRAGLLGSKVTVPR